MSRKKRSFFAPLPPKELAKLRREVGNVLVRARAARREVERQSFPAQIRRDIRYR